MKRGIIYVVAAVLVVAGIVAVVSRLRQRAPEIAADLKMMNADSDDVMASATYQRFAARREAVAIMKTALKNLAAAESLFVADSGRPTTAFIDRYAFANDRSNLGPSIEIQRDRWIAKTGNIHSTISCTLTAMLDSTTTDPITWFYRAGEPLCIGWAAESTALAKANAAASIIPAPEPAPAPVSRAELPRAPRQHHDWGPVNNTPPRIPFIATETCQGEGCTYRGTWAACSTVVALKEKRPDAAPVFTIQSGARFTALTADVHVLEPGMVVFRRPYTTTIPVDEAGLVDITFTPADTLFLLNYIGEGQVVWRFRGSTMRGDMFWDADTPPSSADTVALVRPAKTVWWVRVRNDAGKEGWIVGDYKKMATGGYMDELDRCLRK